MRQFVSRCNIGMGYATMGWDVQDIVITMLEKVKPADLGKVCTNTALTLLELGQGLLSFKDENPAMLAALFVVDLEPIVTMLQRDKANLKKLTSAVAGAESDAEACGANSSGISPLRARLLGHEGGSHIVSSARRFVDENSASLRYQIHSDQLRKLAHTVTMRAETMLDISMGQQDEIEWGQAFEKVADHFIKHSDKFNQDFL